MNRNRRGLDFGMALCLSLCVHGILAVAASNLLRDADAHRPDEAVPLFKSGQIAVELTLVPERFLEEAFIEQSEHLALIKPVVQSRPMPPLEQSPLFPVEEVQERMEPPPPTADGGVDAPDAVPTVDIAPVYPIGSRLRGEQGVVVLDAEVTTDGRVARVHLVQSSGYRALDMAAVRATRQARFAAPVVSASHSSMVVRLPPFRFKLE